MSDTVCYHCGLPVPPRVNFTVNILGQAQPMCCPGCQAVAMAIVDGGLEKFYRFRTGNLTTPDDAFDASDGRENQLRYFDLAEIQTDFVTQNPDGHSTCQLVVKGITCSACAWLIEKYLARFSGIKEVTVNVSTHRCHLVWNQQQTPLSDILFALDNIGYQARPSGDAGNAKAREQEDKQYLLRLGLAGLAMMQAGMVAIGLYAGDFYGIEHQWEALLRWVSFILVTPVVFYSAKPFYVAAWRSLRVKHLVMDLPVSLAILLAYSASTWATLTQSGEVYFDSVAMLTFFLLLGRYLEMRVRHRNDSLALNYSRLIPPVATCVRDGDEITVPVKSLMPGNIVRVPSGATIPCDGEIRQGNSDVIEAILTGEQKPVPKTINSTVSAGTINLSNPILINVHAIGTQTRLANILNLADASAAEKPSRAALVDRIASWFVAVVLLIAICVAIIWWQIDANRALWIVLSVLVVTCPCALSLATPAALTVATGLLRRHGFLIRRGHALETLAAVDTCVFDKTGTLTLGNMKITSVTLLGSPAEATVLQLAAGLEQGSAHPIAKAFNHVKPPRPLFDAVTVCVGEGVRGNYQGQTYALGKPQFVTRVLGHAVEDIHSGNRLLFANSGGLLAWILLEDANRPGAKEAVQALQQSNMNVHLLSGDQTQSVESLAKALNIQQWQASAAPSVKLQVIQSLQRQGHRVMMIGDGINDMPVLSAADVSVAMGDAADVTRLQADCILLSGNLNSLTFALTVAQRTQRIIWQNLSWALIYNAVALPLACLGLVPPWAAAIGMSFSSLLVVLNALRLNKMQSYRANTIEADFL